MTDCFIYDAVRTPRGKGRGDGALHDVTPVRLAVNVLTALRDRNQLNTAQIDDLILGCVEPHADQGADIARIAALAADYAETVPGVQVNRFCASGLEATSMGAAKIMSGQADLIVTGGVESMARIPMGNSAGAWYADPWVGIKTRFVPQGVSADLIATKWGFSREDVDNFAVTSQARALAAREAGRFQKSIVPVRDDLGMTLLDQDEHPRQTTLESLSKLKPSFKALGEEAGFDAIALTHYPELEKIDHVHHAGNSSGVVDGAALVLLGSSAGGERAGLKRRARVRSFCSVGSEPCIMLTGPVEASRRALARAGMKASDIDLFEVNEAFASVPLFFMKLMEVDPARVNVNGGAIAMGHPLGASGAMLVGTVLDELERRDGTTALITLCVGAGMGTTMIIERV